MEKRKLTDSFIRNLPNPGKRVEIPDNIVNGLCLRVTKTGHKSFVFRYRFRDKVKRYTIGTYPAVSLSKGREQAKELSYQVSHGTDPLVEKKTRRKNQPTTLLQAVDAYMEKHLPTLKASTQKDYQYRIKHILKGLGSNQYIKDIKRFEILEFLDGKAPVQAQRIQAILSGIFKFALNRGWVDANIATNINLAGKRKKRKKKWQNTAFDDQQIRSLWNAFDHHSEPVGSLFKMLLILGQRSGETRLMKWSNLDLEKQLWTIPESDTKNSQEHYVPLPEMALNILSHLNSWAENSEYVFASPVKKGEPVGHAQKAAQRIRDKHQIDDFNIHSLRTTFATRIAGLGTPPQVLSKILNHKKPGEGSTITAIYNRYDYEEEKRIAINKWCIELQRILAEETARIHKIG